MSVHTIAAYRHDLRSLAEFGDRRGLERWAAFDHLQMRTFAAALHGKGLGARSIQRRMSAARTFYEFLMREGHCERNPADDVRAPKAKKRLPSTLDADQMGRLLAFRVDDTLSARDKAIMELFYSSGLRLTELVSLDVAAVDLADRTVRVLGKGSKARIVPVGSKGLAALRAWLKERAAVVKTGVDRLFVGRSGRLFFIGFENSLSGRRRNRTLLLFTRHNLKVGVHTGPFFLGILFLVFNINLDAG